MKKNLVVSHTGQVRLIGCFITTGNCDEYVLRGGQPLSTLSALTGNQF
ncbi:hypothetical protein ACFQHW_07065 [Lapidilactobacillus achengensis]|uniref:Uncharacterized protein n=1 Tax=Lapidilactobacillus achengensis TaxID=2486000 RepID=A0ABW1UMW2_9LACO|nr:hypothetical protein [Lapidilactobacillus achengensis]